MPEPTRIGQTRPCLAEARSLADVGVVLYIAKEGSRVGGTCDLDRFTSESYYRQEASP